MKTSIIIRTKNEQKWLGAVLQRLVEQTDQDFEIVIVDSGSTDRTLEIAEKFSVNLIRIQPEEFSYPYALNVGCRAASGTDFFVFLSAHSLPLTKTWLADGLKNFSDRKVFGVYGMMQALPDATIWEKIFFCRLKVLFANFFNIRRTIKKSGVGIMGFTHAAIRRECWEQCNFDERYGLGGEDSVFAEYWFGKKYIAIKDAHFSVAHSHGLGFRALMQQRKYWHSLGKPQPFRKLEFRV